MEREREGRGGNEAHIALGKENREKKSRRENIIHSARALSAVACLVCKSRILLSARSPAISCSGTRRIRHKVAALPEIPRRVTTLADLICTQAIRIIIDLTDRRCVT